MQLLGRNGILNQHFQLLRVPCAIDDFVSGSGLPQADRERVSTYIKGVRSVFGNPVEEWYAINYAADDSWPYRIKVFIPERECTHYYAIVPSERSLMRSPIRIPFPDRPNGTPTRAYFLTIPSDAFMQRLIDRYHLHHHAGSPILTPKDVPHIAKP